MIWGLHTRRGRSRTVSCPPWHHTPAQPFPPGPSAASLSFCRNLSFFPSAGTGKPSGGCRVPSASEASSSTSFSSHSLHSGDPGVTALLSAAPQVQQLQGHRLSDPVVILGDLNEYCPSVQEGRFCCGQRLLQEGA